MLPEVLAFARSDSYRMTNFVRGRGDSSLRWNRNAESSPNDEAKAGLIFVNEILSSSKGTQQRGYKATFGLNEYKTKLAPL